MRTSPIVIEQTMPLLRLSVRWNGEGRSLPLLHCRIGRMGWRMEAAVVFVESRLLHLLPSGTERGWL
jgi:hypothetical protein